MEKNVLKLTNRVSKFFLWLLRGTAVAALSAAIFFFVTGYKIKIEPNCAEAQCVPVSAYDMNYEIVEKGGSPTATCPPGKNVIGGGCSFLCPPLLPATLFESFPANNVTWQCGGVTCGSVTAYAICAKTN